ncbi:MAG TPA: glycosyltransferase family 4 protein [Acidimicrobiales bacterium]|nr:glycosyltransferase family 4 protein [Acidimicrobiales bacterium]
MTHVEGDELKTGTYARPRAVVVGGQASSRTGTNSAPGKVIRVLREAEETEEARVALRTPHAVGAPSDALGRVGSTAQGATLAVPSESAAAGLKAIAQEVGLERAQFVAWRDLDDPEAGGSELHAHRIATQWAAAGIDVTVRTSSVVGQAELLERDGYTAVRRGGRYRVFPMVAREGFTMSARRGEGLVEIWNGMPFFSPLWYRGPRLVFLHHVHAEMWGMVLPAWMARLGESIERSVAPLLYRKSTIVTLSESSRTEIVSLLGLDAERIKVVPPGVEERFAQFPPAEDAKSEAPLVVAVGRLVPVKRFDFLIEALAQARKWIPSLEAVIIGEGFERPRLEELRRRLGAESWIQMPGRLSDSEVISWYHRAWVVAATSLREGWGMTLSEAAACGTPAVATRIAGHADAVVDGVTGLLVDHPGEFSAALQTLLTNSLMRERMAVSAADRASSLTWEATARSTLQALAEEMSSSASTRR